MKIRAEMNSKEISVLEDVNDVLYKLHALTKILKKRMMDEEKEATITLRELNAYATENLVIVGIIAEGVRFCLQSIEK